MPLDDLLALIETLRKRIDEHGAALRQYEAQTRYVLIDPLLRGLGWDTEDPAQVIPEFPIKKGFFSSGKKFVDYALLNGSEPPILIEAKSLGTPLRDDALDQGMNYCWREGINHLVVTDGQLWEIYDVRKRGGSDDTMRIVEFDVTEPPAEVCLKALALWRASVAEGHVRVAETPLVNSSVAERGTEPGSATITVPIPAPASHPTSTSPRAITAEGWIPLTQQAPRGRGEHPPEIRFPDNSTSHLETWTSIVIEVTRWLIQQDLIHMGRLPLQSRENYILATSDVHPPTRRHPRGRKFDASERFGEIYLEAHGNPRTVLAKTTTIIKHAGMDPSEFKVRLAD